MFDHPQFQKTSFDNVPTNRDLYLMSERWMHEFEKSTINMFNGGEHPIVGYVAYAAARQISADAIELSWYPDANVRFHEVKVILPKDEFITCVECSDYDLKPYVFVCDEWLNHLYMRVYSVFLLIDAIGVKNELRTGSLQHEDLIKLRCAIDDLAGDYQELVFVSFADSLLIKGNWRVGHVESEVTYSYEPETFVRIVPQVEKIYRDVLGLKIYAVLTQSVNEYYEDPPCHISQNGNHLSLNSLGLPFAQLLSIDSAARDAIRTETHKPYELYMDADFYHSLRFNFEFEKNEKPCAQYRNPMTDDSSVYFYSSIQTILNNLQSE